METSGTDLPSSEAAKSSALTSPVIADKNAERRARDRERRARKRQLETPEEAAMRKAKNRDAAARRRQMQSSLVADGKGT
eukprot:scaffold367456_cov46-Prasinocladus_malaysianus.AAC.1